MTRQKRKMVALWAVSFTAIFLLGFMFGEMRSSAEEETVVQDVEYESLLGIVEDTPNVDYWTIERDKYIRDNYEDVEWHLKIHYDDGTSVSFDKRDSIYKLFEDLENLDEAKLYTSSEENKK